MLSALNCFSRFQCIPVVISDDYTLPFSCFVDWERFSIRVREDEIDQLPVCFWCILMTAVCLAWNYYMANLHVSSIRKLFRRSLMNNTALCVRTSRSVSPRFRWNNPADLQRACNWAGGQTCIYVPLSRNCWYSRTECLFPPHDRVVYAEICLSISYGLCKRLITLDVLNPFSFGRIVANNRRWFRHFSANT